MLHFYVSFFFGVRAVVIVLFTFPVHKGKCAQSQAERGGGGGRGSCEDRRG